MTTKNAILLSYSQSVRMDFPPLAPTGTLGTRSVSVGGQCFKMGTVVWAKLDGICTSRDVVSTNVQQTETKVVVVADQAIDRSGITPVERPRTIVASGTTIIRSTHTVQPVAVVRMNFAQATQDDPDLGFRRVQSSVDRSWSATGRLVPMMAYMVKGLVDFLKENPLNPTHYAICTRYRAVKRNSVTGGTYTLLDTQLFGTGKPQVGQKVADGVTMELEEEWGLTFKKPYNCVNGDGTSHHVIPISQLRPLDGKTMASIEKKRDDRERKFTFIVTGTLDDLRSVLGKVSVVRKADDNNPEKSQGICGVDLINIGEIQCFISAMVKQDLVGYNRVNWEFAKKASS